MASFLFWQELFTLDQIPNKPNKPNKPIPLSFKESVDAILGEYMDVEDVKLAGNALMAVQSPVYRYYIIVKLLRLSLPLHVQRATSLIGYISSKGNQDYLPQEQLLHGLGIAFQDLHDWELDTPGVRPALLQVVKELEQNDLVPASFVQSQEAFESRHPALKHSLLESLSEYFVTLDKTEIVAIVRAMKCPPFHPMVVKHLVRNALDKPPQKKEAAALLLVALSQNGPISMLQCMRGFELLLLETEDALLDNPQGSQTISEFVARAVVDECLPPSFLEHVLTLRQGDVGLQVLHQAEQLLAQPLAAKKLHSIWIAEPDAQL